MTWAPYTQTLNFEMDVTPTTFRPGRVLWLCLFLFPASMLLILAISEGIHRYKVWEAGGSWCITLSPDGKTTKYYGDHACGFDQPREPI
jgi:hypothetical protein